MFGRFDRPITCLRISITDKRDLRCLSRMPAGGEPLVKRDAVGLIRSLAGIEDLRRVAMTPNGTLLTRFACPLREAGMDSRNVSLDTLDGERYRFLTRVVVLHDTQSREMGG